MGATRCRPSYCPSPTRSTRTEGETLGSRLRERSSRYPLLTLVLDFHLHAKTTVTTVYDLCGYTWYIFNTYSNEGEFMDTDARRRRMRGCVETVTSLVCCTEVNLDSFGGVGKVHRQLSPLGEKERTHDPFKPVIYRAFDMPLACGHLEDDQRQQATRSQCEPQA